LSVQIEVLAGFADDDFVGLVWGAQDESNFYSMTWKRQDQGFSGCISPEGVIVKRVQSPSFPGLQEADIYCPSDTQNSTFLLGPAETLADGWEFGQSYTVTVDHTPSQSDISIVRDGDGVVLASFSVVDSTFPTGFFGSTTYSQSGVCVGPVQASCL
ncbi:MAG: hypothetical protein AAGF11_53565, partial [Myxococcota bacterium]